VICLKGKNVSAQGNALGPVQEENEFRPERASQTGSILVFKCEFEFVAPFQGFDHS
jgi:hypothetical protein